MKKLTNKKYVQAKGRRKTSTSRVRLFDGEGKITINKVNLDQYFGDVFGAAQRIRYLLKKAGLENKVDAMITISGGGRNSQVGAALHALARAILKKDRTMKKTLREEGFLTRDPRMKERKKYGLKRARRAPQWQKR